MNASDPCNCHQSTELQNRVEMLELENAYMRKFMDAAELAEMRKHLAAEWEARMFGNPKYCIASCVNCCRTCDPDWLDEHNECGSCAEEREERRITQIDSEMDPFDPPGAF